MHLNLTHAVPVRVTAELHAAIKDAASAEGISMAGWIRQALMARIKQREQAEQQGEHNHPPQYEMTMRDCPACDRGMGRSAPYSGPAGTPLRPRPGDSGRIA